MPASAIDTSRLFTQARDALQQLQALSGPPKGPAWKATDAPPYLAYEFTPAGVRAAQPGVSSADPSSLRVPLELRGQKIGTISLRRRGSENWTEADRDLAEKTATQVALALENVRLLEETRERALQEQTLSEFSARLSHSVDLDTLLQTAVRELAALPEVADASIYLNPSVRPSETGKP
jgi:GAF domain-containing protein